MDENMDKRESLTVNGEYRLKITNRDSSLPLIITDIIGRGGSCLVYKAKKIDHINDEDEDEDCTESWVIVKEFYPAALNIERLDDKSLDIKNEALFNDYKKHFGEGQKKHIQFYDGNQDIALPKPFFYGEANNTVYSVSALANGTTLSKFNTELFSINAISSIMKSICECIYRIHKKNYVYLDCKPDNFFYFGSDNDLQKQVFLFDFDTCTNIKDVKSKENKFCSASLGWAPEEQEIVKDPYDGEIGYKKPQQIGFHTDIYSIGAIFFWLLTKRKPNESDLRAIQAQTFDWTTESRQCFGLDWNLIKDIQKIAETTLQPDVDIRAHMFRHYDAVDKIKKDFNVLHISTVHDNPNFKPYHSEISKLDNGISNINNGMSSLNNEMVEVKNIVSNLKQIIRSSLVEKSETIPKCSSLPVSTNRFKYNSNSTSLMGRDAEISFLTDMCDDPQPFYWVGICGVGGSGKSRLAYELCSKMIEKDWHVFSPMRFNEYNKNDIISVINKHCMNTLICLDYIKQEKDDISVFIKYIIDNLHKSNYKIRILLIEREEKDVRMDDYEINKYIYSGNINGEAVDGIICLNNMSEDIIPSIIEDYIINQNPEAMISDESLDLIINTLQSVDSEYRRPLYALFIADAWLNNADVRKWDRDDALRYLLSREMQRLTSIVKNPKYLINAVDQDKYLNAIKFIYVLATYMGSIDINDYNDLLSEKYNLQNNDPLYIQIMKEFGIINDEGTVEGWVPDLLGEYFCADYFNDYYNQNGLDGIKDFVSLLINRDFSAYIRYTDQIFKDFKDIVDKADWADAFSNIEFPSRYSYVRKNLFSGMIFLKSISFTSRINSIQSNAFKNCELLEEIVLPSSLEIIEKYAFSGCKNLRKVLPEDGRGMNPSVIRIENFAFHDCVSLKDIILPVSLQEIGISAFENCRSIKEIDIPRKIHIIDKSVFSGCSALEKVKFKGINSITLSENSFMDCINLKFMEGLKRVSKIGRNTFRNCDSLESISFSSNLKEICDSAFSGCHSLKNVDFSDCDIDHVPERLFYDCCSLNEIILPDTIECIEDKSFFGCENIENINFSSRLRSIGRYAFYGCKKITSISFSKSLQLIKQSAFENCSELNNISFEDAPKVIEAHAFAGCTSLKYSSIKGLESVKPLNFGGFKFSYFSKKEFTFIQQYMSKPHLIIPATVCAIESEAFRGLIDEDGEKKNTTLISVVFPKGLRKIGDSAFRGCECLKSVRFQNSFPIKIEASAFSGCIKLETIIGKIPVNEIGDSTFKNCSSLKELYLSEKINNIGKKAFMGCSKLEKIHIEDNSIPSNIGTGAFKGCSLLNDLFDTERIKSYQIKPDSLNIEGFVFREITEKELQFIKGYSESPCLNIPETCIDISKVAFCDIKGLESITLPDSIKKLPAGVFKNCVSLKTVELPADLNFIQDYAFCNCESLKNITFRGQLPNTIPDGVKIAAGAFKGCKNICSLILPNDISAIRDYTFWGCNSLKEFDIPNNVKKIGNYAFKHCRSLQMVRLPDTLKSIGKGAFTNCIRLTHVTNMENTNLFVLSNNLFESCINLESIKLPKSITLIKGHVFKDCHSLKIPRNFLPSGLLRIESAAFQGCYSIESIRIPNKITEICDYTFKNCSSLKEVRLHDNLKHIGQSAFYHCNSLVDEGIELPASLESLGICAFAYCNNLKRFTIPERVKSLPYGLLKECTALEEVFIPKHITEIPEDCFKFCISLRTFNLHEGLSAICVGAFRNCTSLAYDTLTLPESLQNLEDSAFRYCDSIKKVKIPQGIRELSSAVFEGCVNLNEVNFEHHISLVHNYAFSDCYHLESFPFDLIDVGIRDAAFQNCKAITSPTFSKTIKNIGSAAFRGCIGIEYLNLPDSITKINGATFRDNSNLKEVILPETVSVIHKSAFRDCINLSDVQIKSSIIDIKRTVFKGCKGLDYIELPKESNIYPDAFEDCPVEIEYRD